MLKDILLCKERQLVNFQVTECELDTFSSTTIAQLITFAAFESLESSSFISIVKLVAFDICREERCSCDGEEYASRIAKKLKKGTI